MQVLEPGSDFQLPDGSAGSAVTVGTFDGVHRGHRDVLLRLGRLAREQGLVSVVVTFEPHPLEVVNPAAAPQLLTVRDERVKLFADSGIDYVAILDFTRELSELPAESFVDRILISRFHMSTLLVGHDHGFGRNRMGDPGFLQIMGKARGFTVDIVPAVEQSVGLPISSTAIRRAIAGGDLDRAAIGLGRPYSISGIVGAGAGRGKGLGYPTLNLTGLSARKLLPPDGVYAVRVRVSGLEFGGMVNLGGRPTFGEEERILEAHLFDASGDWYGEPVEVEIVSRIREVRRFSSPDALKAQLEADEALARRVLRL